MDFTTTAKSPPTWRYILTRPGWNAGVITKLLTAVIFCVTIVSIVSSNVDVRTGVISEELQASRAFRSAPDQNLGMLGAPTGSDHAVGTPVVNTNAETKTVADFVRDKMSAWNAWRGSDRDSGRGVNNQEARGPQSELVIASSESSASLRPLIIKLMMLTAWDQSAYERAIRLHEAHARRHGYAMNVLRQPILSDVWSKPAYILSCLLRELAKSPGERAQWLFWFDADTILLNPNMPLDVFLPPANFDDVNLLVGYDWNGLNNGVYPIRVHPWSVELLTTILTFPIYKPDEPLPLRDQTAMEEVLRMPRFSRHTAIVPMKWFNGYHRVINESAEHMMARPGDLLVHLAGVPDRFTIMEQWLQKVEDHLPQYELEYKQTSYPTDIRIFWNEFAEKRRHTEQEVEQLTLEANQLDEAHKGLVTDRLDELKLKADPMTVKSILDAFDRRKKIFNDFYMKQDLGLVREVTMDFKEVCNTLKGLMQTTETFSKFPVSAAFSVVTTEVASVRAWP